MAEPRQKDLADLITNHEDRLRGLENVAPFGWRNIRTGVALWTTNATHSISFSPQFDTDILTIQGAVFNISGKVIVWQLITWDATGFTFNLQDVVAFAATSTYFEWFALGY